MSVPGFELADGGGGKAEMGTPVSLRRVGGVCAPFCHKSDPITKTPGTACSGS